MSDFVKVLFLSHDLLIVLAPNIDLLKHALVNQHDLVLVTELFIVQVRV